jgi:hypothetical protein
LQLPAALAALFMVAVIGGSLLLHAPEEGPTLTTEAPRFLQAVSADGMTLASMDQAGALTIETRGRGKVVVATVFRPDQVAAMWISDDGTRVICELRTGEMVVWDASTGKRVAVHTRHRYPWLSAPIQT